MNNNALKTTLAGFAMIALSVLGGGPADAHDSDDSINIRMKFAGALLLNLEQQQVDSNNIPVGMTGLIGMSSAKAVGNLGKADISVVTKSHGVVPMPDTACPDGFLKVAEITDNAIVFTFSDLSLLYGDGQGVVCVNFANGAQFASIDGAWTGGAKRFSNAAGEFSIAIDKIMPIGTNTQFSAEAGRISGFLKRD